MVKENPVSGIRKKVYKIQVIAPDKSTRTERIIAESYLEAENVVRQNNPDCTFKLLWEEKRYAKRHGANKRVLQKIFLQSMKLSIWLGIGGAVLYKVKPRFGIYVLMAAFLCLIVSGILSRIR
jgi:hypothetical protein